MIEKAEQEGILKKGDTLIETSSGNTGIALAAIGLLKGYKVRIMISTIASKERVNLLKFLGAEVIFYDHNAGRKVAIETAKKLVKQNNWVMLNQYENEANVMAQEDTANEILEAINLENIVPDYLVLGIGTGGTITGIAKVLKNKYSNLKVIGIIPEDKIEGIRDFRDINPKILDLSLVDEIIKITELQSRQAIGELAHKYGILSGFSSGAAFHISKSLANKFNGKNIITLFPDGMEKYLSYI